MLELSDGLAGPFLRWDELRLTIRLPHARSWEGLSSRGSGTGHSWGRQGRGRAASVVPGGVAAISLSCFCFLCSSSLTPVSVAWVSPPSTWPHLRLQVTGAPLNCNSAFPEEKVLDQVWAPCWMSCTRRLDRWEPAGCQADPCGRVYHLAGTVISASWATVSMGQHLQGPQPRLTVQPRC